MTNVLSDAYYHNSIAVEPLLRVRRPLEEEVCRSLKERNIFITGIPKIGKSLLRRAVIAKSPDGTMRAGFSLKGVESKEDLDKLVQKKLQCLSRTLNGSEKIGIEEPLKSFGGSNTEIFLGIDDLDAIERLGKEDISDLLIKLSNPPKNIHLIVASQKNPKIDEIAEKEFASFETVTLARLTDNETDYLIREPARVAGLGYRNEAAERLAELSGNRPWDIFILCYITAAVLEQHNYISFDAPITQEQVEHIIDLPFLAKCEVSKKLLENYKVLMDRCLSSEELEALKKINLGIFVDDQDLIKRLQRFGVLNGARINGELLHEVFEMGFPVS